MYVELAYLILLVVVCLFIGFKVGTFVEARYWNAYIQFNKDQVIIMLRHVIKHKDIRIDELVKENNDLVKYRDGIYNPNIEKFEFSENNKG